MNTIIAGCRAAKHNSCSTAAPVKKCRLHCMIKSTNHFSALLPCRSAILNANLPRSTENRYNPRFSAAAMMTGENHKDTCQDEDTSQSPKEAHCSSRRHTRSEINEHENYTSIFLSHRSDNWIALKQTYKNRYEKNNVTAYSEANDVCKCETRRGPVCT